MKISEIPHVIFETTTQFSFQFSINIQFHQAQPLCNFFNSNIIDFGQRQPIKSVNVLDFRVLGSKFIKILMSILKRQVNSSSRFASFYLVMTNNSPVNFKLIYFLLWIKQSHESPNFETFKCSGENSSNSLCYFPYHKSHFFQILHHFLVS